MISSGWVVFLVSEFFFVSSLIFFQLSIKSPATAIYDLAMWLCSVVAIWTFGRALAHFDVSSLLALWLGVAMLAVSAVSLLVLQEQFSFWKAISLAITAIGVVGLILTSKI